VVVASAVDHVVYADLDEVHVVFGPWLAVDDLRPDV